MKTLLSFIFLFVIHSVVAQELTDLNFDNYIEADVQGGYGVGGLTAIKGGKVVPPKYTRWMILKNIADSTNFVLAERTIPEHTYDKTKSEQGRLKLNIKASSVLTAVEKAELAAALNSTTVISLKAWKGKVLSFKAGVGIMNEAYRNLKAPFVCDYLNETKKANQIISEALQYDSALYTYTWGKQLSAGLLLKLQSVIQIEGKYSQDSNGNLHIKYNKPVITGVKTEKVSKYQKDLLKKRKKQLGC